MKLEKTTLRIFCGALALLIATISVTAATADSMPIPPGVINPISVPDIAPVSQEAEDEAEPVYTSKKTETVYVNLTADGKARETIITDWLHSDIPGAQLEDRTTMQDFVNIKGDEQPKQSGNALTWNLEENDLYYQGTSNKSLPLEVSITYSLDGKTLSPEELAGKSGKMEMHLSFKNTTKHKVTVAGKEVIMQTPLMVLAGMSLSNDNFSNVTVSDGSVVSDGNNQAVSFVVMPGLSDSLNLGGYSIQEINDLDFPEEFTVTADVVDFEMGPIGIAVTTKLPNMDDIKKSDDFDDMRQDLYDLRDMQDDVERADPVRELRSLFTDPERTEGAQLLVADIFEFYDLNKDILDILPKYITDENIKLYDRINHDLKENSIDKLYKDDNFQDLLDLMDDMQTAKLDELMKDYKKLDPKALKELISQCESLMGEFGTADAKKNIATLKALTGCSGDIMLLLQDMQKSQAMLTTESLKALTIANLKAPIPETGKISSAHQETLKYVLHACGKDSLIPLLGTDMEAVAAPDGKSIMGLTSDSFDTVPETESKLANESSSEAAGESSSETESESSSEAESESSSEPASSSAASAEAVSAESFTTRVNVLAAQVDASEISEATETPKETEAPSTEAPKEPEAPSTEAPKEPEVPSTETPEESEAPTTETPEDMAPPAAAEAPEITKAPEQPQGSAAGTTNRQKLVAGIESGITGLDETKFQTVFEKDPTIGTLLALREHSASLLTKLAAVNPPESGAGSMSESFKFANDMLEKVNTLKPLIDKCFKNVPENERLEAMKNFKQHLADNKDNFVTLRVLMEKMKDNDLLDLFEDYDDLRDDMRDARPILKALRRDLNQREINKSLHESPHTTDTLLKMKEDLEFHRDISESLRWAVMPQNVEISRGIISTLDRLKDKDAIGDAINKVDDLDELLDRKEAFVALSDQYRIFTDAADDMDTDLKFIMKTDEIKIPEPEEEEVVVVPEKHKFLHWLENMFA